MSLRNAVDSTTKRGFSSGYALGIKNFYTGETFYALSDSDAVGREVYTYRNSGVETWRDFDQATGRQLEMQTAVVPDGAWGDRREGRDTHGSS